MKHIKDMRLKYISMLEERIKECEHIAKRLVKVKSSIINHIDYEIGTEIVLEKSLVDKRSLDALRELNFLNKAGVEEFIDFLNKKEEEVIYIRSMEKLLDSQVHSLNSKYLNEVIYNAKERAIEYKKNLLKDIEIIKEDVSKAIAIEALNIEAYEIDSLFTKDIDPFTEEYRLISSSEGFFVVRDGDDNSLILIQDLDYDKSRNLRIEFERKVEYKNRIIYIGIKNSIPIEQLPFK